MHHFIPPSNLPTLLYEADAAARRLHRKLRLPPVDLEDLRQDLLVDLIRRISGYDARRGTMGAFANVVLRHQCTRIAIRTHRRRRLEGHVVLSLDTPSAGAVEPLGCVLAESDGLAAWHGQDHCASDDAELRHDLAQALGALSDDARGLCVALCQYAVAELAGRDGVSRSTLYRRLARLRLDLAMCGLGARGTA